MATTKDVLKFAFYKIQGCTFSELQRFVVEANGYDYDEMEETRVFNYARNKVETKMKRRHRGYWCDAFCRSNGRGILRTYFERGNDGKWHLTPYVRATLSLT